MEGAGPTPMNTEISETIPIEQDHLKYNLIIKTTGDIISFNLDYNSDHYSKKVPLKEIKDKESKAVFSQYSCKDFIKFLKTLSEMKKISLAESNNKMLIKFEVEMMLKNIL